MQKEGRGRWEAGPWGDRQEEEEEELGEAGGREEGAEGCRARGESRRGLAFTLRL